MRKKDCQKGFTEAFVIEEVLNKLKYILVYINLLFGRCMHRIVIPEQYSTLYFRFVKSLM